MVLDLQCSSTTDNSNTEIDQSEHTLRDSSVSDTARMRGSQKEFYAGVVQGVHDVRGFLTRRVRTPTQGPRLEQDSAYVAFFNQAQEE